MVHEKRTTNGKAGTQSIQRTTSLSHSTGLAPGLRAASAEGGTVRTAGQHGRHGHSCIVSSSSSSSGCGETRVVKRFLVICAIGVATGTGCNANGVKHIRHHVQDSVDNTFIMKMMVNSVHIWPVDLVYVESDTRGSSAQWVQIAQPPWRYFSLRGFTQAGRRQNF